MAPELLEGFGAESFSSDINTPGSRARFLLHVPGRPSAAPNRRSIAACCPAVQIFAERPSLGVSLHFLGRYVFDVRREVPVVPFRIFGRVAAVAVELVLGHLEDLRARLL